MVFITASDVPPFQGGAKGLADQSASGVVGPAAIFVDSGKQQLAKDFQVQGKAISQLASQSAKRDYVRRGMMSEGDELGEMVIERGIVRRSFIRK